MHSNILKWEYGIVREAIFFFYKMFEVGMIG